MTSLHQDRIVPFVRSLPRDGSRYFEILNASQTRKMHSGMVVLQKGENVGSHSTGPYEEVLVILEGSGEVEADGFGRKEVEKGCIAYIPPETRHNVFNPGEQELRYIFIVAKVLP